MRNSPFSWRLAVSALALACGSDGSTGPDEMYRATLTGTVATESGGGYADAIVFAGVWDESGLALSAVDTVVTDATGAYAIELALDSLPAASAPELHVGVRPALGSGYQRMSQVFPLGFVNPDQSVEHVFTLEIESDRIEDAAAVLDPDRLTIDMYEGETVAPHSLGFLTTLRLRVDSVTDAAYGRFSVYYAATTISPEGTLRATLASDTAYAVLADTANAVAGGNCGGTFELELSATSVTADTLVAWFRRGTATGCHVDEAPFRLVRVPVQSDFE